jgi:hypothetical protein
MTSTSPPTIGTHRASGSAVSKGKRRDDAAAEVAQKLLQARREARMTGPAASETLKAFCADLDQLKGRLSEAINAPGAPAEWGARLDAVRNSIPHEHGSLGLAFTKALALAQKSASTGDEANYLLGLRRLWTAFSMLQLTLSL